MNTLPEPKSKNTTPTRRWFLTLAVSTPIVVWTIWLII